MELRALELRLVELELVLPLSTGIGTHARRPVVLARLETDAAEGIGECDALAEPTYTSEYAQGAFAVLRDHLGPRFLSDGESVNIEQALARLAPVRGHEMARAALEMALLDAALRSEGRSLATALGATRSHVAGGATIGLGGIDEVLDAVDAAVKVGYERVKLKVTPGALPVLRAVRDAYPDLALCADANGTFSLPRDEAELEAIGALGLTYLEQPLPARDLDGHAWLVAAGLAIVLDESVTNAAELDAALQIGACTGVSIKPARVGGLMEAAALARRAAASGCGCALGGMLEAGIGRAAALCLAGRPEFDLPGDLGASDRYFVPDLTAPHVLIEGMLAVPSGPGLGVEVKEELIERTTIASARLSAT